MRRLLLNALTALSLLLLAAVLVLWVRSYFTIDHVVLEKNGWGKYDRVIMSEDGWIAVGVHGQFNLPGGVEFATERGVVEYSHLFWIFVAMPLLRLVFWRERRIRERDRRQRGLCPACGYDLRATPDRCPECGTVAEGPVPSAPADG